MVKLDLDIPFVCGQSPKGTMMTPVITTLVITTLVLNTYYLIFWIVALILVYNSIEPIFYLNGSIVIFITHVVLILNLIIYFFLLANPTNKGGIAHCWSNIKRSHFIFQLVQQEDWKRRKKILWLIWARKRRKRKTNGHLGKTTHGKRSANKYGAKIEFWRQNWSCESLALTVYLRVCILCSSFRPDAILKTPIRYTSLASA